MNKREQLERFNEFTARGCPREFAAVIVDAEESCDRLRKKLAQANALIEKLKRRHP